MPSLRSTLNEYDLDFLRRIARAWGTTIDLKDQESALRDLLSYMTASENFHERLDSLADQARNALNDLVVQSGHLPLAAYTRKYGQIRSFGPARREREEPDLHPVSTTEMLWYAGLVGKAFLKIGAEVQEYIYIPDEFLAMIRKSATDHEALSLRPAVNQSPRYVQPASSVILDHLTDLLASIRMARELPSAVFGQWRMPREFLNGLLQSSQLVDDQGQPDPHILKNFLLSSRSDALLQVYLAWRNSGKINELRLLPGLVFEGNWVNDPLTTRRFVLDVLTGIQPGTWISMSSLLAAVKEKHPDFQRFAGEYQSWYIRREGSTEFLSGYEHWDDIEGALLTYLIWGPLFWLGVLDLARGTAEGKTTAFRLTPDGKSMLEATVLVPSKPENREIEFKLADTLVVHENTPRSLRYQVGRFAEIKKVTPNSSWYQLTPASLASAAGQGLKIHQLIQLLEKSQSRPLPKSLLLIAERWESRNLEAEIKTALLMRFTDEHTCTLFQKNPRSAPMIIEQLNLTTLSIHPSSREAAQRLLAEMGILSETEAVV